jgi:hypothetical protein
MVKPEETITHILNTIPENILQAAAANIFDLFRKYKCIIHKD